jgi:hypothetical protein
LGHGFFTKRDEAAGCRTQESTSAGQEFVRAIAVESA